MGAVSPLSANIVVNQVFIVAATAQSRQRQNKAFIIFVHSPLPVKIFYSLAFTSTSCSSLSLCVCVCWKSFSREGLLLFSSHGTLEFELRSERRSGQQREQAGPVFDRCVLL